MFKSLLNAGAVSMDSLILDVFIILGVVVAGALIVYFLWEAVNAFIAKSKKTSEPQELKLDDVDDKQKQGVAEVSLDDVKTAEDEVVVLDENNLEDVDDQKAQEEKEESDEIMAEQDRENAERRAYLEARRQELLRRMQAEIEDDIEESEDETAEPETETVDTENVAEATEVETVADEQQETTEDQVAEAIETPVEETETAETVEEERAEEVVEATADVDALEDERKALEAEKERYAVMIKELEEAKRALAETQVETPVVEETANNAPALSLDELKERLANAEERLRATEKEFKQCKKEYIPLRRVWDAHEKDEKKLRRKEALVAKQKVLLYGVNNYADIDEEKAKKLAEDLDLLDGLKLSVQHCEEVMKNNEERYPLLEKMYKVLKLRNDELKNDIATYRAEIEKLEGETSEEN